MKRGKKRFKLCKGSKQGAVQAELLTTLTAIGEAWPILQALRASDGNPYHDALGKFTTGGSGGHGKHHAKRQRRKERLRKKWHAEAKEMKAEHRGHWRQLKRDQKREHKRIRGQQRHDRVEFGKEYHAEQAKLKQEHVDEHKPGYKAAGEKLRGSYKERFNDLKAGQKKERGEQRKEFADQRQGVREDHAKDRKALIEEAKADVRKRVGRSIDGLQTAEEGKSGRRRNSLDWWGENPGVGLESRDGRVQSDNSANPQARNAGRGRHASQRFHPSRTHKASSAESILKHCLRQLGYTRRWREGRLTGRQHLRLLEAIRQYGRAWMRHEAEVFFGYYGIAVDVVDNGARSIESGIMVERALADRILSPLRRWFDRARNFVRELLFAGAMSMAGDEPLDVKEIAELDRQAQVQAEYLERFRQRIETNPPPELVQPAAFPSTVIIIQEPKPRTVPQIIADAELYGNSVWTTVINTGRKIVRAESFVFEDERRVHLLPEWAHPACKTCLDQSSLGWQPLGTLNEIGDSECQGACDCYFEWRDSQGEIYVSPWGRHNPKGHNIPGMPGTKKPGIEHEGQPSDIIDLVAEPPGLPVNAPIAGPPPK